jgi:ABC-type transport system substrate-binding protein
MRNRKTFAAISLIAATSVALAACGNQGTPVVQIKEVTKVVNNDVIKEVVKEVTKVVNNEVIKEVVKEVEKAGPTAAPEWTTPHPILGDIKVRQAIAHCTNRNELIAVSYPFLSDEEKGKLQMDTWIPKISQFYANPNNVQYTFDITGGGKLLDEAGWKLPEGGTIRENSKGDPMIIRFTTTTAQFRQTWGSVFEKQMSKCGIVIQRSHIPGGIWFGSNSGLRRRDFDLGAFAWVGEPDPSGESLYACNKIPTPANNWEGQNYMGWCDEKATVAIRNANNSLNVEERKKFYAEHQDAFAKAMVSLPVFQRAEAGAYTSKLKNVKFNPTEYYSASADKWEGKDSAVLAFSQEPASMFSLVESSAVQRTAAQLVFGASTTAYDYGYQTTEYEGDKFPTIGDGAENKDVVLKDGDKFVGTDGNVYALKGGKVVSLKDGAAGDEEAKDIKVKDLSGKEQPAAVGAKAPQISVTYKHKADKWSDGTPVTKADRELSFKINCDRTSGSTSYDGCDRIASVVFADDNSYTTTFVPGYQNFFYYLNGAQGAYPSFQEIKSSGPYQGKKLADVSAKDFATLPEIAELPLGSGPYILKSWKKGEAMTFEANPNYRGGAPKVKRVVVRFYGDTNGAVAALLAGQADVVGTETLGAGSEVQAVIDAKKAGKAIEVFTQATPTWEHIDMNLNVR